MTIPLTPGSIVYGCLPCSAGAVEIRIGPNGEHELVRELSYHEFTALEPRQPYAGSWDERVPAINQDRFDHHINRLVLEFMGVRPGFGAAEIPEGTREEQLFAAVFGLLIEAQQLAARVQKLEKQAAADDGR